MRNAISDRGLRQVLGCGVAALALLAGLIGEADGRRDDEVDSGVLKPLGDLFPFRDRKDDPEMRHRDVVAVDLVARFAAGSAGGVVCGPRPTMRPTIIVIASKRLSVCRGAPVCGLALTLVRPLVGGAGPVDRAAPGGAPGDTG